MKRIVSILLFCTMFLTFLSAVCYGTPYSPWAKSEIEAAYKAKIISEQEEYDFNAPISRAKFYHLIDDFIALKTTYYDDWEKELTEDGKKPMPALEVPDEVVAHSLDYMFIHGFLKGTGDGNFGLLDSLTREEAASIIVRVINKVMPMAVTEKWFAYEDLNEISEWASDDVQTISNLGLMFGVGENRFAPQETITVEQAVVLVYRVYVEYKLSQRLMYEDTERSILAQYKIVDEADLEKQGEISVFEALLALDKARCEYTEDFTSADLKEWYRGTHLQHMDNLPDSTKALLMRLCYEGTRRILRIQEVKDLRLDEPLTHYQAILYVSRLIGDAYYDFWGPDVPTETDALYALALKKGLLDAADTSGAQEVISRQCFYALLHKALFAEWVNASAMEIYVERWIDRLEKLASSNGITTAPESIEYVPIQLDAQFTENLTLFWEVPENMQFLETEAYGLSVDLISVEDEETLLYSGSRFEKQVKGIEIIEGMIKNNCPDSYKSIRLEYRKAGIDTRYYAEIPLPQITYKQEMTVPVPDRLVTPKHKPQQQEFQSYEVSLADGHTYLSQLYYILREKSNDFRKDEYNSKGTFLFQSAQQTNVAHLSEKEYRPLYSETAETRLQVLEITGNPEAGFVFNLSPVSEKVFEVL